MNILLCIPIIVNTDVARECIKQVINKTNVTVVLCNNGGGPDIDQLLSEFKDVENVLFWKRKTNVYVNPIWNDFMEYFLTMDEWDHLIIMNSDLTMQKDWDEIVNNRWEKRPHESLLPMVNDDKTLMYQDEDTRFAVGKQVYEGIPGIFITLTKKQAKLVYPIPADDIKIWFGDTWLYTILAALGEKIIIPGNLRAFHHHSTSVQKVPNIYEMIENDKTIWEAVVSNKMIERIEQLKKEETI